MNLVPILFITIASLLSFDCVNCLTIEERQQANVLYMKLKKIETGYVDEVSKNDENIGKYSDDEILQLIEHQYVNIKCSYIFSSLTHMHSVKSLLVDDVPHKDIVFNLSFERHIKLMLATINNLTIIRLDANELWLLYVYLKQLQDFFRSSYKTQIKTRENLVMIHGIIALSLRERTNAICDNENIFNYHFKNSLFHRKFKISERIKFEKEFYTKEHFTDINKILMEEQITDNASYGLTTAGYEYFSKDILYLNGVIVNDRYMEQLNQIVNMGVKLENILNIMKAKYEKARAEYWPDRQIKRLAKFHTTFIHTMTMIMLRSIWQYAAKLMSYPRVIYSISSYNQRVNNNLIIFIQFFVLRQNDNYYKLLDALENRSSSSAKKNAELIAEVTKTLIIDLSKKYKFCKEPLVLNDIPADDFIVKYYNKSKGLKKIPPNEDIKYWIDIYVTKIEYFVEYISWILKGIQFSVINNFVLDSKNLITLSAYDKNNKMINI